jgi:hypothetical protein
MPTRAFHKPQFLSGSLNISLLGFGFRSWEDKMANGSVSGVGNWNVRYRHDTRRRELPVMRLSLSKLP